jgi:serine/threonine protein phosphatase PrpC
MDCSSIAISHVGSREKNEDSFYNHADKRLFIVADGLGGHSGGEIASSLAADVASKYITCKIKNSSVPSRPEILENAIFYTQRELLKLNSGKKNIDQMATTLTVLSIDDSVAHFGHIGDCRIYLINSRIHQLTTDHTMAARLRESGVPLPSIGVHNDSVLTQCLGMPRRIEPQLGEIRVVGGDRVIICSDGFYRSIACENILMLSNESRDLEILVSKLENHLCCNIPNDNATLVAVEFTDGA